MEPTGLDAELEDALARITGRSERPRHELVRALFLRLLGLVYAFAFLGATQQLPALIGSRGLLPASLYLERLTAARGGAGEAFLAQPTLFVLTGASNAALLVVAYGGLALSLFVLFGGTNAIAMALLWALQLSLVHVGQVFYGYGWEILLLEAGFLAIFLCPIRSIRPLPAWETPVAIVWLLRWLAFRVMFGAGLIKLRGDACWTDLSCLEHHYETQPLPNPMSWALHMAPDWVGAAGVIANHVVELVVPFFLFGPRRLRYVGGALIIAFQATLVVSGNLSFLNWLTIAVSVSAFDDRLLARVAPRLRVPEPPPSHLAARITSWTVFAIVVVLSVDPLMNLFERRQIMNGSFDRLHLVNTYGAFGSVNRERYEIVLEGTHDDADDPRARWRAYELPCKPGDPLRAPCIRAPYHDRLDWQMWFASFRDHEDEPWIVHLIAKLLAGDREVMALFANDPFPDRPPRFVRASYYRYRFARPGEPGWWQRERLGDYLRPLSRDDPELIAFLRWHGWSISE